jgi:hypothetical protein
MAQRHMNVETGTEAAHFPEKEYIMEFSLQCVSLKSVRFTFIFCLIAANFLLPFLPTVTKALKTTVICITQLYVWFLKFFGKTHADSITLTSHYFTKKNI